MIDFLIFCCLVFAAYCVFKAAQDWDWEAIGAFVKLLVWLVVIIAIVKFIWSVV